MKKRLLMVAIVLTVALGSAVIADAYAQAKKETQPRAQTSTTITGRQAQLDLETRVAILEREVARLRVQVDHLVARSSEPGIRYVGPDRTINAPSGDKDDKLKYTGPQPRLPPPSKED